MGEKPLDINLSADKVRQKATTEFIQKQYGMSNDMASLWARAIEIEERSGRNEGKAEMAGSLREHINATLAEANKSREATPETQKEKVETKKPQRLADMMKGKSPEEQRQIKEQAEKNRIIRWLRIALEKNDHFHAYVSMEEAISHGIDLSELIESTKTDLDPAAMEKELRAEMQNKKGDGTIVIDDLPIAIGA